LLKEASNKGNNNNDADDNSFISFGLNSPVNQADNNNSQNRNHYALQNPRYAVLILDMLNDFVYGKLKCEGAKKIVPNIANLINVARQKNIPIFYCIDQHISSDIHELKLWGHHAMKGTEGADIIDDLKPSSSSNDYIIQKRAYSAFDHTKLGVALKRLYNGKGPDTLIITGLTTDICCRHTAYDAFTRGFNILVAEDATTAFTVEDHILGLKYMQRDYGIKIRKVNDIIKSLDGIKEINNSLLQHQHY
jgi:nicotinamidase-related amidase